MPTEQKPRYLINSDELKALAHPLRQQMLVRLRIQGPATSADLAVEFSQDRGATSYHLRQLARHHYIEVDEQLSAGRRKFWRAIPQDLRLPAPDQLDEAGKTAAAELGRWWLQDGLDQLARHYRERGSDPVWDDAAMVSIGTYRLTAEELKRFGEEYVEFAKRRNRSLEDSPADAEPITALFAAFKRPGGAL